ncbi:nickel-dependent lactate racemase [Ruminococcaceae bacterium OttesenSCG-928-L11]|nr:nickel-dependent lactate racemase [Ruminococcaceae bacterium OttesenSCG-928-L11]
MNTVFDFAYGKQQISMDLSAADSVQVLQAAEMPVIADLKAYFYDACTKHAVKSQPLNQLVSIGDKVTVVISDITRFWMRQDKIVPLLVDFLVEECGVFPKDIAILVALGTHRAQTEDELRRLVTDEVYERISVTNHDCMAEDLVYVGTTSRGTEVRVNPLAVGRKVIVVGGTVHHLMAGYGGGRKNILPGICAKSTINQNHIHSLNPDLPESNPLIGLGKLARNPVNEDMDEAASLVGPVFGINLITDSASRHCHVICGHWQAAWRESCRIVEAAMGVPIDWPADMVVVSCGGFPRDISLYQGVKSLLNASRAVKNGGDVIFLAQCPEGGGAPEYFSWIEPLRKGTLDPDLRANFSIAGYIFYASVEASAKCTVHMLTDIAPEIIAPMQIRATNDLETLLSGVDFAGKRVYVMPYGGNTVPVPAKIGD